jgi:hypothetical protein
VDGGVARRGAGAARPTEKGSASKAGLDRDSDRGRGRGRKAGAVVEASGALRTWSRSGELLLTGQRGPPVQVARLDG